MAADKVSKLEERFGLLRKIKKKALILFIPYGFPNIPLSLKILRFLDSQGGVDVIELGVPFSDPLADGPIIQKASNFAIEKGATLQNLFDNLEREAPSFTKPLVLMSYYNPIYNFGIRRFLQRCKRGGISGTMIVDLPLEEAEEYIRQARKFNLDTIFFVTPTTSWERMKEIVRVSRGFIYYVSVTGITGPKKISVCFLAKNIAMVKRYTQLPVCVGFGIHTQAQARMISEISDGIIVGSALVKYIEKHRQEKNFFQNLSSYLEKFYV